MTQTSRSFAERLAQARALRDYTQEQLADIVGLSKHTIRAGEQGTRQPKDVAALAKALEVEFDWLKYGIGSMLLGEAAEVDPGADDGYVSVAYFEEPASVGSGSKKDGALSYKQMKFSKDMLEQKGLDAGTLKTYQAVGESMAPGIRNGDGVVFDSADVKIVHGKIFVVRWKQEILVRRLRYNGAQLFACSDNKYLPEWAEDMPINTAKEDWQVLGRVRCVVGWIE